MELIKPMLAKTYISSKFVPGMFGQPKLDGIRALYQDGQFVSRDGIVWSEHCFRDLKAYLSSVIPPDIILDGEFYIHGTSLQQINSRCAVKRITPHPKEHEVVFHCFDTVQLLPFYDRYVMFKQAYPLEHSQFSFVKTYKLDTEVVGTNMFLEFKRQRYEGLMYRHPTDPYSIPSMCGNKQNRSWSLMKRKSWLDLDATIVGCLPGEGKYSETLGSFQLAYCGIVFSAGSGLSDFQRDLYWRHRTAMLGSTVKIQYETLSDTGIPLKPIILLVDAPEL